jgi:hypothetical protein
MFAGLTQISCFETLGFYLWRRKTNNNFYWRQFTSENKNEIKLSDRRCVPCEGGIKPLDFNQIEDLKKQLHPEWKVHQNECSKLTRTFILKNFVSALSFLNQVGELAEALGHHPGSSFLVIYF